jgi:hypothetical protein
VWEMRGVLSRLRSLVITERPVAALPQRCALDAARCSRLTPAAPPCLHARHRHTGQPRPHSTRCMLYMHFAHHAWMMHCVPGTTLAVEMLLHGVEMMRKPYPVRAVWGRQCALPGRAGRNLPNLMHGGRRTAARGQSQTRRRPRHGLEPLPHRHPPRHRLVMSSAARSIRGGIAYTGAGGDNGIDHNKNRLRFPYVSTF